MHIMICDRFVLTMCLLHITAADTKIPITSIRPKNSKGQFPIVDEKSNAAVIPTAAVLALEVDEERGEVPVASGDAEERGSVASPVPAEPAPAIMETLEEQASVDDISILDPVADTGTISSGLIPEMAPARSDDISVYSKGTQSGMPPELLAHMNSLEDVESRDLTISHADGQRNGDRQNRRRCWIVGACALVILVIVGTVLGVLLGGGSKSAPSPLSENVEAPPSDSPPFVEPTTGTEPDTEAGTETEIETETETETPVTLQALIASVSLDGGASFSDPLSPQSKALTWLEGNANLDDYPDWRKIQRHTLALFYISTNGDDWVERDGWLTDEHECDWFTSDVYPACDEIGAFIRLALSNNNVTGTLPKDLAILSNSMRAIAFRDAPLTGSIPTEIALLTNLGECRKPLCLMT